MLTGIFFRMKIPKIICNLKPKIKAWKKMPLYGTAVLKTEDLTP